MPRSLVFSNGRLYIALDERLDIRDLTWPHVGSLNHLSGAHCRVGVWVEGHFAWLGDDTWRRSPGYRPDTSLGMTTADSSELGITLHFEDELPSDLDCLIRSITVTNHGDAAREVRLFFSHDFNLDESDIGDTVMFNPFNDSLVHYKRRTYLMMAAEAQGHRISQYACGIMGFGGAQGTWRDAEDGALSMNPVAQGSVDSVFACHLHLPPNGSDNCRMFLAVAGSLDEACAALHKAKGRTARDHSNAINCSLPHQTESAVSRLPDSTASLYRRSLLTILAQCDHQGAILAANDSDIMETARAHYSYMWPRDGAIVAQALSSAGLIDPVRRFFGFCAKVLPADRGALLHKYVSDGSWGSTWHPWIVGGAPEVAIQEDSTALCLWSLWQHYLNHRDRDLIDDLYSRFVIPCGDFLADFRNQQTGLPCPSWDLWEERRGVHAYTCGTVFGGLEAAANLSDLFGDGRADRWRQAASEVRQGTLEHLWQEDRQRFARRLGSGHDGGESTEPDLTLDSAIVALFLFGMLDADHPKIEASIRQILSRLWVRSEVGGIARYENDYYFRQSDDIERIPGNPWCICTLWAAQWYIARAKTHDDLFTALELIRWCESKASPSGMLAEQFHGVTGAPLSVSPLTWSHAEFVRTALQYQTKAEQLDS